MIDKTDAAYMLGWKNFRDDRTMQENPFHESCQAHGLWSAGWLDAEADACERQDLRAAEDGR